MNARTVFFITLTFIVMVGYAMHVDDQPSCDIPRQDARFDCHPDDDPTAARCTARGCCWHPVSGLHFQSSDSVYVPFCYFPKDYAGYSASEITETDYGYQATLKRTSGSGWPNDVTTLAFQLWMETPQRLRFKVTLIYLKALLNATTRKKL